MLLKISVYKYLIKKKNVCYKNGWTYAFIKSNEHTTHTNAMYVVHPCAENESGIISCISRMLFPVQFIVLNVCYGQQLGHKCIKPFNTLFHHDRLVIVIVTRTCRTYESILL